MTSRALFIHIALIFILHLSESQPGQETCQQDTLCSCDLQPDVCDINCCCDCDCAKNETSLFTACTHQPQVDDPHLCLHPAHIIFNRSEQAKTYDKGGLLCIYTDNYKERATYEIPIAPDNDIQFVHYKHLYASVHNSTTNPLFESRLASINKVYKVDDAMLAFTSQSVLTPFTLPIAAVTDVCDGEAPIGMLRDSDRNCLFRLNRDSCETNAFLSARYFSQRYDRILTSPQLLDRFSGDSLVLESDLVDQLRSESSVVMQTEPISQAVLTPTWNEVDAVCDNVLKTADFTVVVNNTAGVHTVTLRVALTTAKPGVISVRHRVKFEWSHDIERSGATWDPPPIVRLSGNPGYEFDQPVMAGNLLKNEDDNLYAIQLVKNSHQWLTVTKASQNCNASTNDRQSVLFGVNMATGCMISIPRDMSASACRSLQRQVISAYTTGWRDRVAAFANASIDVIGDWLQVLVDKPPTETIDHGDVKTNGCQLTLSLAIEILYAKTGSVGNAQSKIIGVMYRYDTAKPVKFQCLGPSCLSVQGAPDSQLQPILTTVTFIDVSNPVEPSVAVFPTIDIQLPHDFFYPFTGASGQLTLNSLLLLFACFIVILPHLLFDFV